MTTPRFFRATLAIAAAILTLSSSAALAADPVEVDAVLPMTGFGGFIGKGASEGLTAAETVVNKSGGIGGRPIKFVIHDDQSSPQVAVQLATDIIGRKKAIFLGAAFASQCNAIAPLVKDGGTVVYCVTPSVQPPAGSYVFSIDPGTADAQLPACVRYFRQRGITRVALIASTDASGQDGERAIDAAFALPENAGAAIVDREHFAPSDISVAAQMARIKASNAQLLIAITSGTPFGTVLRDALTSGFNLPVLTTNANMTFAQMTQYAQFMPAELYFPGFSSVTPNQIADARLRASVQEYDRTLAAQGAKPEFMQSTTYDPALIIASALRKLGPNASASAIRDYIGQLRGFPAASGIYDFRTYPQRGLGQSSVIVVRWDHAKQSWVAVSKPGGAPL
jgi:branched-chain amino acid transport system substrate-binding protein